MLGITARHIEGRGAPYGPADHGTVSDEHRVEDSLTRTQNITVRMDGVLCVLLTLCCDLLSTAE